MWLLVVGAVGGLLPGGLFLYWLLHDSGTLAAALSDRLALAFFVDLLGSTGLLTYLFARKSLGPLKWPWFVALSLLSTLRFGVALYLWLNWRRAPEPRPGFASWWRAA